MAAEEKTEVPDGVAVFPEIPAELGVHPLLLAVLHATVFLAGSDDKVVNPAAADEAVQQIAQYLQRLDARALKVAREDMAVLAKHARSLKWPKQDVRALESFLADLGVGEQSED